MRSGRGDRIFAGGVTGLALIVPLTLAGITLLMVEAAWPSITRTAGFLTSTTWTRQEIFARLRTSTAPSSDGDRGHPGRAGRGRRRDLPRRVRTARVAGTLSFLIEVLAYIPSIVYGSGLFVLVPLFAKRRALPPGDLASAGRRGLFDGPVGGRDLLVGGVILAIMILPCLSRFS